MEEPLQTCADDYVCYLTTTGRVTGKAHTIEIWFAVSGAKIYMLAGDRDRADWIRNLRRNPEVAVRLRERLYPGMAYEVTDPEEDALARRLLVDKYDPIEGGGLGEWGRTSLPVAIKLSLKP